MKAKNKTDQTSGPETQNRYQLNKQKRPTMKSGKVVLGILAGLAAGALLGIILAPEKGSRTRKRMVNKGEGYVDGLKDKFDDFLTNMTEKLESNWQGAEEVVANGKAKVEEVKKEVKNGIL
jgi:gas vesicle protein